jgi:SP family general alpha glucoside:H+ symporter-like MFS transporter
LSSSYVNACWVLGQLLASIVLRATMSSESEWSYRIPFALQWIFPLPILVAVYFAPESPWWLIRQSRFDAAKHNLRRLRSQRPGADDETFEKDLDKSVQEMHETNEKERNAQSGTRYVDCFKGTDRRRTEIACMCWIIQTLCGSTFMGFSTYFCKSTSSSSPYLPHPFFLYTNTLQDEQAGLPSPHAFTLSLAQFALGLLGVVISWLLMSYYGRRTLYLSGQALTFLFVLSIGILACIPPSYSHQLVHSRPPPHLHTYIRRNDWTYLLLASKRNSEHKAEE